MTQKKLGRGLGALVRLDPASADGTARFDEAIRADPPETSVLSLSGRSVEDYFRVAAGVENVPARRVGPAPAAAPVAAAVAAAVAAPAPRPAESCVAAAAVDDLRSAPATPRPSAPPDPVPPSPDDDPARQYLLFDPPVEAAAPASSRVAETPPAPQATQPTPAPAPPPDEPAFVDDVVADVVIDAEFVPGDGSPAAPVFVPAPVPAPAPAPAAPARPAPAPAEPSAPVLLDDDDVVFLDEAVGGIVLPDVDLE